MGVCLVNLLGNASFLTVFSPNNFLVHQMVGETYYILLVIIYGLQCFDAVG